MEKKSFPSDKRGFVRIGRDLFWRNSAFTDRMFLNASLREVKSWAGAISVEKTTTVMRALKKMNLFILLSFTRTLLKKSKCKAPEIQKSGGRATPQMGVFD